MLVGHALGARSRRRSPPPAIAGSTPESATRSPRWRERRLAREPVARIVGIKEFWSLPLQRRSPTMLVPRPETETVVEAALAAIDRAARARAAAHRRSRHRLGRDAAGAALANLPNAFGVGTDIESAARCGCARHNAPAVAACDRAAFVACDLRRGARRTVRSRRRQPALYRDRRHRRACARGARPRSARGARRRRRWA